MLRFVLLIFLLVIATVPARGDSVNRPAPASCKNGASPCPSSCKNGQGWGCHPIFPPRNKAVNCGVCNGANNNGWLMQQTCGADMCVCRCDSGQLRWDASLEGFTCPYAKGNITLDSPSSAPSGFVGRVLAGRNCGKRVGKCADGLICGCQNPYYCSCMAQNPPNTECIGPTPPPTPPTTPPPTPGVCWNYACGSGLASDCIINGNPKAYCNRCATEGGARPLRGRCSNCCDTSVCAQYGKTESCNGNRATSYTVTANFQITAGVDSAADWQKIQPLWKDALVRTLKSKTGSNNWNVNVKSTSFRRTAQTVVADLTTPQSNAANTATTTMDSSTFEQALNNNVKSAAASSNDAAVNSIGTTFNSNVQGTPTLKTNYSPSPSASSSGVGGFVIGVILLVCVAVVVGIIAGINMLMGNSFAQPGSESASSAVGVSVNEVADPEGKDEMNPESKDEEINGKI